MNRDEINPPTQRDWAPDLQYQAKAFADPPWKQQDYGESSLILAPPLPRRMGVCQIDGGSLCQRSSPQLPLLAADEIQPRHRHESLIDSKPPGCGSGVQRSRSQPECSRSSTLVKACPNTGPARAAELGVDTVVVPDDSRSDEWCPMSIGQQFRSRS